MKSTLSLKDFIKESLVDINTGVIEAADAGVSVVYNKYNSGSYPKVQTVTFDLAVSIEEENSSQKEKSGGLAISVFNGRIGKQDEKKQSENLMNRIQFSVEVFLGHKNPKDEE